ncbi:MAG TPA: phosphate-starvation-inducible PsiE family protein [Mucilaginibacter sp.]|jgi:uncharacterized membrane protein (DUF373 family)
MENLFVKFEKYISYFLMALAMLYVCYQTIYLTYLFALKLVLSIQNETFATEEKGKPVAGLFFSILLLLEIIQTIRVFSQEHSVKVRVILIVGLIAVTRKILIFDMEDADAASQFAVAALVICLSTGYYLVSRSQGASKK